MTARKTPDIANRVRKDILAGRYGSEGGLPETRELAQRYEVAINTMVAALANLEGQRLIEKRGHSYYVNEITFTMTQYVPPIHMRPSQYSHNLGDVERIDMPAHIAEKLKLAPAPQVVYRGQVSGEITPAQVECPYMLSYHYFIMPLSNRELARMQDDAMYDEIKFANTPEQMRCHDEITSRLLTAEEAQHLSVAPSTSANSVFVTMRALDDTLLFVQEFVISPRVTLVYDYVFENKPK